MSNNEQNYATLKFLYELGIDEVIEPHPTNKKTFSKESFNLKEDNMPTNNAKSAITQITKAITNKEKEALSLMSHAGSTRDLAAQAKTLGDLRALVENYNECPLKKNGNKYCI
jgi:hypothetical protein